MVGIDSAEYDNNEQELNQIFPDISTTLHSTLNHIHFLPPHTFKENSTTAWIIVVVVVGTILFVFVFILVVRQLVNMFRNRNYQKIYSPNEKTPIDITDINDIDYNNRKIPIKNRTHFIDSSDDDNNTINTDNTDNNDKQIITNNFPSKSAKKIKKNKNKKKKKIKKKKKKKLITKHARKDTISLSHPSQVIMVSSDSNNNDNDDNKNDMKFKPNVIFQVSDTDNEYSDEYYDGNGDDDDDDDDDVDVSPQHDHDRDRKSVTRNTSIGFSVGTISNKTSSDDG